MVVQCKIKEWKVKLIQKQCLISISKNETEVKKIKTKLFNERGFKMFPMELYKIICKDLTAANIYDRFLDKYFTWDENDSDC